MKRVRLVNPYSQEAYLITGISQAGFLAFLKKEFPNYTPVPDKPDNGTAAQFEDPIDKDGVQSYFIWVRKEMVKSDKRLSVIHEVAHMCISIFASVILPIKPGCDEAFTYLQEDLCRQIFKEMKL